MDLNKTKLLEYVTEFVNKQEAFIRQLLDRIAAYKDRENNNTWVYQDDGTDRLDTLTCSVVIAPHVLRVMALLVPSPCCGGADLAELRQQVAALHPELRADQIVTYVQNVLKANEDMRKELVVGRLRAETDAASLEIKNKDMKDALMLKSAAYSRASEAASSLGKQCHDLKASNHRLRNRLSRYEDPDGALNLRVYQDGEAQSQPAKTCADPCSTMESPSFPLVINLDSPEQARQVKDAILSMLNSQKQQYSTELEALKSEVELLRNKAQTDHGEWDKLHNLRDLVGEVRDWLNDHGWLKLGQLPDSLAANSHVGGKPSFNDLVFLMISVYNQIAPRHGEKSKAEGCTQEQCLLGTEGCKNK